MSESQPGPGHNLPSLADTLAPAVIDSLIEVETAPLKARAAALTASCLRFLEAHPKIESDEQDGVAAELLAVLQRFTSSAGRVETARVAFKAPLLAAQRAVDAAFKEIGPDLSIRSLKERKAPLNVVEQILYRSIAFKAEKDRAEQARAAAEAKRLEDEAAEAELLADKGGASYDDAAAAADKAEKARQVAAAPPAERTRARGGDFGTTSMVKKRIFEVISPALVPRPYCEPSDALIRHAIGKPGDPIPKIAGVSIRDVDDMTVRK